MVNLSTNPRKTPRRAPVRRRPSRGAIAIIVALSLVALIGMFGLAVDSGRLYVTRAELQTAADACALAAAQELRCQAGASACPDVFLVNAEAAGRAVGTTTNAVNRAKLQSDAVTIGANDILFATALSPNDAYLSRAAGAPTNSRYAMCRARSNAIVPWVMGVLGAGPSDVSATAVATLAPGQTFCSNAPIGICSKAGGAAPSFGYTIGEWITANFNSSGQGNNVSNDVDGGFRWVDFTPNAGGNSEIRDQLAGQQKVCGLVVGNNIQQPGTQQGAKLAYNTRFGIYAQGSGYDETTARPDYTGYAYPNKSPGSPVIRFGTSAYADYIRRQAANAPFDEAQYDRGNDQIITGRDRNSTSAQHATFGLDRRLISVPVINCAGGNVTPMIGLACVLMLNPMSKGNNGTVYMEYRGSPSVGNSPCRTLGGVGGPGSNGPLVTTLVQ